jgi:hypothetical protein
MNTYELLLVAVILKPPGGFPGIIYSRHPFYTTMWVIPYDDIIT